MSDTPKTPWEELGIPRGNWIDLCLMYGIYKYPKIQARMRYPRHTEVEWSTVTTITKKNYMDEVKLWADALTWGCPVRMTGLRGEVFREHTPRY